MRKTIIQWAAVAAISAGMALAQGPGYSRRGPGNPPRQGAPGEGTAPEGFRQRHFDFLATYLGLTESQKQQAQSIFDARDQASQALRDPLRQAQRALNEAAKANRSDSEIDQLAAALGALQGQMAAIQAKSSAKFNALLTPEQQEKLGKMPGPPLPMGGFPRR